jgi:signal transduction histidine kinase
MLEFLKHLFDSSDFAPRSVGNGWTTELGWLHQGADALICLSYLTIGLLLIYFVRKRKGMPFSSVFWMFAAFIIVCGLAHFAEVFMFTLPAYRLSGVLKALAAVVSGAMIIGLIVVMPRALAMRMPEDLERENAERKQAEGDLSRQTLELQEKNRKLLESERLKNQFFANVSHELRTPLSLILAPVETLLAGEFGEINDRQRTGGQTIHNNAVRLLQMVTGLLDLARVEAHQVEIKRESVDVAELTRALVKDFGPILQQKELRIDTDLPPEGQSVLVDRYLYERILFNLLANAVKFTPAGGEIHVGVKTEDNRLILSVTDTGIGIAAADIPNLFQKFRQLEGSSTRRFEGCGLGLALVKEFAELLDGTVGVASEAGRGSTFLVDLAAPNVGSGDSVKQFPATSRMVQRFSTPVLGETTDPDLNTEKRPRVLIAEDNVELASYIAGLLRRNCEIRTARNGNAALQLIRQWPPDLILADVMMPERDGLSLCRTLKADPAHRHIPVVLLTALIDREALLKGWEAGADEYLFKPFHPRELTARVQSMLTAHRERQRSEAVLREARDALELRVSERTAELGRVNQELQSENRQRQQLEVELRRRVEQLALEQQRKDEFLATLGHELRNPLAPIRNSARILRMKRLDDPETRPLCEMMERQVLHMTRLVDDLLDVSRVSRGEIHLRNEAVDLLAVVRGAVDIVKPLIDKCGHRLVLDLPDSPLLLRGDRTRLEQALANLLNNAAKYTPHEGRIDLSVEGTDDSALIRVRDNGIGIRPEIAPHVFELFFQGDTLPGQLNEGLGIGLTLVRRLVEMHGGTVEARSEGSGRGSAFTVSLPLAQPESSPEPARHTDGSTNKGLRVLAVDDNQDALQSTALLLELSGYEVQQAHDGSEGLAKARPFMPDVVLLDIGLPGMDGYEVARKLRKLPGLERVLIVALTGYSQAEDRQRSAEAGFDHHLTKPVDPDELQALLAGMALSIA